MRFLKTCKENALKQFYLVKSASYTRYERKRLSRGKGIVRTNNPRERTVHHRGKTYAYDHREYTHGTAKRLGAVMGIAGGVGGAMSRKGLKAAPLGALIAGGGGYVLGRSLMNNMGEEGVQGLIDQKAKHDLKRIKLRRID